MNKFLLLIRDHLVIGPEAKGQIYATLLVIVVILMIRWLILRITFRHFEDVKARYRLRKTSLYTAVGIIFVVLCMIWFKQIQSVSMVLGLLSAGLAIALQRPIVNLAAWAFILTRRPFEVGDRIQVGEVRGDVIDQRIFQFTMMEIGNWVDADQSTGRVIHVPNGKVFEEILANYSKGFQYIWDEIPVLVTFESDWRKAKEILLEIANKHADHLGAEAKRRIRLAAKRFMIFYSKLTPTVYTSVRDCGVLLTLRFLAPPRQRRGIEQAIWEDILDAFAECDDIDFAYPTQRFYNNVSEGKEGARATPPD